MAVTVDYTEVFPERATRGIEITFKDSDDNAVVPDSANWSLTTAPSYRDQGVIMNGRDGVNISGLSSTIVIILSGADLQILTDEAEYKYVRRALLVEYTYDDPNLGVGVSDKLQYIFRLENLYNVI